jgi:hypothetical protein
MWRNINNNVNIINKRSISVMACNNGVIINNENNNNVAYQWRNQRNGVIINNNEMSIISIISNQ